MAPIHYAVSVFDLFILTFLTGLLYLYRRRWQKVNCTTKQEPVGTTNFCSAAWQWYVWPLIYLLRGKAKIKKEAKRGFIEEPHRVDKERSWADTPSDILSEIYSRLLAGERAMFRSTCRSWNSVGKSVVVTSTQHDQFQLPPPYNNNKSECSSACLLLLNNRMFHPIYERFHHMDFVYLPCLTVYMANDGWFLGKQSHKKVIFWNPFTEEKVILPEIDSGYITSACFSSVPTTTSRDWSVILAVTSLRESYGIGIYTIKSGDDGWTSCKFSQPQEMENPPPFILSDCNPVVYKGLYYLLGRGARLLIHDPMSQTFHFHEAPECISRLQSYSDWEQYMVVESSSGILLAVFVGCDGTLVITLQWNSCEEKWETVESLEDKMLFVSNTQSLCIKATTMGTGNKIYFPRLAGGSRCLFYSLSTKRLHTFEAATCHAQSFIGSKAPLHATWWIL